MKPTYLYRAVSSRTGAVLGRQTGYLSRSAAVSAGRRLGTDYEVVRSEPVIFLSRAERLHKRAAELEAEAAELRAEAEGVAPW